MIKPDEELLTQCYVYIPSEEEIDSWLEVDLTKQWLVKLSEINACNHKLFMLESFFSELERKQKKSVEK